MIHKDKVKLKEQLSCSMVRGRNVMEQFLLKGLWISEIWRAGKLIDTLYAPNDITTVGKNALFDTFYNGAAQITSTSWCAGLINATGFTGYAPGTDTMASHPGWVEWTAYSQATRVAWGQGAATGGSVSNSAPMVFDITGTGTVQGLFLTTVNAKGGTTGLLWSAASYTAPPAVVPGDQIRSTYALSA